VAAAALGLDPGLAFIHLDTPARDSLACDLMEPIRPEVEGWLLDWITREPLKREWFFEEPNGTCRLMAPLAIRLAETAPMWARAVAPVAEWVARHLWSRQRKSTYEALPPTRLTQRHKREAKGSSPQASLERAPRTRAFVTVAAKTSSMDGATVRGVPYRSKQSESFKLRAWRGTLRIRWKRAPKRADTVRQRRKEQAAWAKSSQPGWLTEKFYVEKIRPALASVSNSTIASLLGVSRCHASQIRSGKTQRASPALAGNWHAW